MLHISAMYSREDIVKLLLSKRGVDPFATGGVSIRTIQLKVLNLKSAFQNFQLLLCTILILILNNSTIVSNIGFTRPSLNAEK